AAFLGAAIYFKVVNTMKSGKEDHWICGVGLVIGPKRRPVERRSAGLAGAYNKNTPSPQALRSWFWRSSAFGYSLAYNGDSLSRGNPLLVALASGKVMLH
ncbi:hypothetical protein CLAIMM_12752 isoform 1, partial [Cladophialophora immunda]